VASGNPDTSSARSVSQHDQGTYRTDNRLFWYPMKRETTGEGLGDRDEFQGFC
jgi:hypothetical protein